MRAGRQPCTARLKHSGKQDRRLPFDMSSPALPDWRISRSPVIGKIRAACYHFATQLDGTGQNAAVWRQGCECILGPKTLTSWHATKRGGTASFEVGIQSRCGRARGVQETASRTSR